MAQRDAQAHGFTLLSPAGGMVLSLGVSGLLWGGMAVAAHLAGAL